ncbi:hypothetical protein ACIQGZ_25920 [Streptomyces sp. NPDC092296]|uniref:hypothetical protein n=1 Tax=Streptomyces sp. NPDC092296 TaxID=3366012 RepID=UPI00381ABFBD
MTARPTVVPHVTTWSGEKPVRLRELTVRPDGKGLGYRHEQPGDRDAHGVLWVRLGGEPGTGRPTYRVMHSERQRRTMLDLRCQICAGPASRTAQGWLFLVAHTEQQIAEAGGTEDMLTMQPPLCLPCADTAVRQCPRLTEQYTAVRSRKPVLYGAWGSLYRPDPHGRLAELGDGTVLPYSDPAVRWLLAAQLVRELRRTTVIPLPTELPPTPPTPVLRQPAAAPGIPVPRRPAGRA